MANTQLCNSSKAHVHTPVSLRKPLRCGFSILLCSCLFFGGQECVARGRQDVAAAARQERARKEQAKKSKHVYTDEDLRRDKILTPDDEARLAAGRKEQAAPPAEAVQTSLDADVELAQLPLGDIARRYRDAKLAVQGPSPFHLPLDETVLAAPVNPAPSAEAAPLDFAPVHPNIVRTRPSTAAAPAMRQPALRRVDPFMRRFAPPVPHVGTRVAPSAPQVQVAPSIVAPAVAAPSFAAPSMAAPSVAAPPVAARIAPSVPKLKTAPSMVAPSVAAPAVAAPSFAAPSMVAPSVAAPSVAARIAPSVPKLKTAPSMVAPSVAAPAFAAPSMAAPSVVAPSVVTPSVIAPSVIAPSVAAPSLASRPSVVAKTSSSPRMVTMQPGDSLWKVAEEHLGRGSRWPELLAANPGLVDPTRIAAGTEIVVPDRGSKLKADVKVTVQKGDTLSKIAKAQYGRAANWQCIAQANPQVGDANRIYEGQELLVPAACKR